MTERMPAVDDQGQVILLNPAADGKIFLLVRVAPLRQKERETYGAVGVLQEITEFKKLDQLRHNFIVNVAYELRTPLTSIQVFVEALLDGMAKEQSVQEEYLEVMEVGKT